MRDSLTPCSFGARLRMPDDATQSKSAALRPPWFGPLGGWELLRLARRGQVLRARLLVLYLLFIAFIITPILWFSAIDPVELFTGTSQTISLQDAASFASRFAMAMLQAILLAVVAMAPASAAAAIAEEKERQTLPLLLTTPLSDREIVLGKAAGRLIFVLAAAAGGIPVLMGTMLFGGVDIRFLLTGCVLIASTAILATAIGIHAACSAADLRGAVLRAYGVTAAVICGFFIPPCVLLSPFAVMVWLEFGSERGFAVAGALAYAALQLIGAAAFLLGAVQQIRHGDLPAFLPQASPAYGRKTPASMEVVDDWRPVEWLPVPPLQPRDWVPDLPPIGDIHPLLWKERNVTGRKVAQAEANSARNVRIGFGCLA